MQVLVRPLIASVLCAGAALLTYNLLAAYISFIIATFAAIAAAALIYGLLIFLIGAITRDDIALLPKGEKLCRMFEKLHLLKKA